MSQLKQSGRYHPYGIPQLRNLNPGHQQPIPLPNSDPCFVHTLVERPKMTHTKQSVKMDNTQLANVLKPPMEKNYTSKILNVKSLEAKHLKTFFCTTCSKWFNSGYHLRRHFSTRKHEVAVKLNENLPRITHSGTMPGIWCTPCHTHPTVINNSSSKSKETCKGGENHQQIIAQQPLTSFGHIQESFENMSKKPFYDTINLNNNAIKSEVIDIDECKDQITLVSESESPFQDEFSNEEYKFAPMIAVKSEQIDIEECALQNSNTALPEFEFVCIKKMEPTFKQEQQHDELALNTHDIKTESTQYYEDNTTVTSTTGVPAYQDVIKCFDCNKVFKKKAYLTQHNMTYHNGEKPFKCMRCGKRFASEDIYQNHVIKHDGDKPYKCETCPKQFHHKADLKRHSTCHTGIKPFVCVTCGKGFVRNDHLERHMETHSSINFF